MSKVVAAMVAGTGGVAAAVGGTYMLQRNGEGAGDKSSSTTTTTIKKEDKKLMFDSVDNFKKSAKDFDCVKQYFGVLDVDAGDSNATEVSSTSTVATGTFFKSDNPDASSKYESCLVVNWKTETYGESSSAKGKGTFTGIGTFVRGDEGFINFNLAKTSDTEDGKLTFEGIFYLVSKKSDSSWELKYKKSSNSGVKADKNGLDEYFPKLGTIKNYTEKPYWEFIDNTGKLDSMCKSGECSSDPEPLVKEEKMIWKKVDGTEDSKKLKDGCENFKWGEKLYSKDNFDLEDKIKDFVGEGSLNTTSTSPGA